jgi:hypothetical protein
LLIKRSIVVEVGSKVVRPAADEVRDAVTDMARAKTVFGSQADKAIGERATHPDIVALASGATTCGDDEQWAAILTRPGLAKDEV